MTPSSRSRRRFDDEGSTLPELMVAMALFTVLVLALGTTSILGWRVSSTLQNRLDNATQGQVAIDAASKVLRTAILPSQLTALVCVGCESTALVQASRTQVAFYANLNNTGSGPSLITLQVVKDDFASQTSGSLVQTLQLPMSAGPGKYSFCNKVTTPTCVVQTRVLARGLAWPAVDLFGYYNFDGTLITTPTLASEDLASVASVEVTLTVQTVRGQTRFPASTVVKRVRLPNSDINVLVDGTTP